MPFSFNSIFQLHWITIILGVFLSSFITFFAIPRIVYTAKKKELFANTNSRTSHKDIVPTLGGIAVFAGFVISSIIIGGSFFDNELLYIVCGLVIVFFIGVKDDLTISHPWKKLLGQVVAASVVAFFADIRINDFYGLFKIYQISFIPSLVFTLFVFIVLTNGFNLIDGIDGLASGVGIICSVTFGTWFWIIGNIGYAIVGFTFAGALASFFYFNVFSRTYKLFLGDTGSLLIGFTLSIFVCKFLQIDLTEKSSLYIQSAPAVAIGILIIPLFDTLRVFTLRIWQGKSPFVADRQHIHHRLIDLGLTHLHATITMVIVNIVFIILSFLLKGIGVFNLTMVIIGLASLLSIVLNKIGNKKSISTEKTDFTFEGTWKRKIITKSANIRPEKEKKNSVGTQYSSPISIDSSETFEETEPPVSQENTIIIRNEKIQAG